MTESSAHGVILWMVLRWRRPLSAMRLCHCGLLSGVDQKSCCVWQGHFGGFLLCIAQVSMRKLPSLAVMPSAFLSLLSSCLVLPAVSLYNTVSYQKRDGAAQNLIPCWSGSTMLPTPFTCSALAVCALSLHHPWTPKEGCVHPHP